MALSLEEYVFVAAVFLCLHLFKPQGNTKEEIFPQICRSVELLVFLSLRGCLVSLGILAFTLPHLFLHTNPDGLILKSRNPPSGNGALTSGMSLVSFPCSVLTPQSCCAKYGFLGTLGSSIVSLRGTSSTYPLL